MLLFLVERYSFTDVYTIFFTSLSLHYQIFILYSLLILYNNFLFLTLSFNSNLINSSTLNLITELCRGNYFLLLNLKLLQKFSNFSLINLYSLKSPYFIIYCFFSFILCYENKSSPTKYDFFILLYTILDAISTLSIKLYNLFTFLPLIFKNFKSILYINSFFNFTKLFIDPFLLRFTL